MKNDENVLRIINEKKITEEDLYFLSHIEGIKSTAGIFKEKYNKYMHGILKKYNVNSIDFLMISRYVKQHNFHLMPDLVEKYGPYKLDESKTSFDFKGFKAFAIILITVVAAFVLFKMFLQPNVDPCKCSEVGANAQMIGYDNLSEESKKIFNACEKKYSTPADAYEDCVNKSMPK